MRTSLIAACLVFSAFPVLNYSKEISGHILNETGEPVSNAVVKLFIHSEASFIETKSDPSGYYVFDIPAFPHAAERPEKAISIPATASLTINTSAPSNTHTLSYVVGSEGLYELQALDLKGRLINRLFQRYHQPGHYVKQYHESDNFVPNNASGRYMVVLMKNGRIVAKNRMVKTSGIHFQLAAESSDTPVVSSFADDGAYTIAVTGKGFSPFQQSVYKGEVHKNIRVHSTRLWESYRGILRDNLQNARTSFIQKKRGRVGFLGGSITFNPGWRDSVEHYLNRKFPNTQFTFIRAGISSTGALMHTFRYRHDMLKDGPLDLLFVETAVNDTINLRTAIERRRSTEGIVRQALTDNPYLDIIHLHFAHPDYYSYVHNDRAIPAITDYELVSKYYNTSMINLALHVAENYSWEAFGNNVHPGPLGSSIYGNAAIYLLEVAFASASCQPLRQMPHFIGKEMLDSLSYINGRFYTIDKAKELSGWEKDLNWVPEKGTTQPGFVNIPMLSADVPGAELKIKFTGRAVGIIGTQGLDAGVIDYEIDGKIRGTIDLFTKWSKYHHLPRVNLFSSDLEPGEHSLKIIINKNKNLQSQGNACHIKTFVVNGTPPI